jgi:hypothetical protein
LHQTPFLAARARGKSKLIANLILDNKTNDEIRDYWVVNGLGERVGDLRNELIHNTRSELKHRGLLDDLGIPLKKVDSVLSKESPPSPAPNPDQGSLGEGGGKALPESAPINEVHEFQPAPRGEVHEFQLHPDWDVLTPETINHIVDPVLRARILNYKAEVAKVKQTLKPEYATQGEIDLLRNDFATRIGGIEESINRFITKFDDPEEGQEPEESDPEEEEEEATPPKKPLRLATAVNRLEAVEQETTQEGSDDDLIEVEGVVIIRKHIGFTAKSVARAKLAAHYGAKTTVFKVVGTDL